MSMQNGDLIGSYSIIKSLSEEGGMSRVFLAQDTERQQYKVALKVHLAQDENSTIFQDLLRREALYLKELRHPGIVRIYPLRIDNTISYVACAHEQKNRPWYYAMEYIPGDNLEKHIKTIKTYPLEWIVEFFYQLLTTIHYMHQRGYAHCDLKPQNILFRYPPERNQIPIPVLVDFGSVTSLQRGIHQLAASIRYSPPEVIVALDRHDIPVERLHLPPEKVDIWALGAILFEIVTGRPLINRKNRKEITTTILRGELENMSKYRKEVHSSLDRLLSVMLRTNPLERPDSESLIEAIEERISSVRPPRISLL